MRLDVTCLKCASVKYYVKTVVLPEKNKVLKLHFGTYYLKVCAECGFVEIYAAEIVDKDKEKVQNEIPNPEV
ncbi:MAG: hypothetical protein KBE73_02470 [Fusobacteriaceae bacterium]|nr:hypothetical protein [Fusobacteriaceae bacterium]